MRFLFLFLLCAQLSAESLLAPERQYPGWEEFEGFNGYPPYITEFGYRAITNHVIDGNHKEFDPSRVKLGDIVYVGVKFINWFADQVHDKIPSPYILITCDMGGYIPNPGLHKLIFDPKLVCWFAKNMLFSNHSKFYQLPMGQFYHCWMKKVGAAIPHLDYLVRNPPKEKDILLYLNYTERDCGRRSGVADLFWDKPYCFNRNRPRRETSFEEYWDEVSRSKFVLSPLRMEVDCTRTWECFILGAIPIVEHTYLDPLYEKLPILLIHDWHQVDESFLKQKYEEIRKKPHAIEKAYIDYWYQLIREKQQAIRRGDQTLAALESQNFSQNDIRTILHILSKNNKLKTPLLYKGNLTTLRPFQLAQFLTKVPSFTLLDVWTQYGWTHFLKEAYKSSVSIVEVSQTEQLLAKTNKTVFLDLTHFRHKLFKDVDELDDFTFCHSLERDIASVYQKLFKGELLFGNMATDPYVQEVLERLRTQQRIGVETLDNFFIIMKK